MPFLNTAERQDDNTISIHRSSLKTSDPQKIVYVSVDNLLGKVDSIHDILNAYFELTGIDPVSEEVYIFLDEIHTREGWQTQLKYYLDSHATCRFIVSGSSKTLLYKDASESLVGRIRFIDVFPLTFKEFIEFSGVSVPEELHARIDDFQELEKAYFSVITERQRLFASYESLSRGRRLSRVVQDPGC